MESWRDREIEKERETHTHTDWERLPERYVHGQRNR